MPKAKEEKVEEPVESVQREAEEAARAGAPAPQDTEVRPEDFTAGIGKPVVGSAWPDELVEELRKPLDPNRIRRREGRGSTKLEYLAGHDVKRRANELFGFGNWGHRVKELSEIAAVEVKNRDGKDGWHVGYRCIVTIWIRHDQSVFETDGVGYGDGVEYSAAARVQACELAVKESETDALKRAFTDLGDQFGLILYAKGDEKGKIERDRQAGESRTARVNDAGRGRPHPETWPELFSRFAVVLHDPGQAEEWVRQLIVQHYGVESGSIRGLGGDDRKHVFAKVRALLLDLEGMGDEQVIFHDDLRNLISTKFKERFDGVGLVGPEWAIGNGELASFPSHADWKAQEEEKASADAPPKEEKAPVAA